MLPLAVLSLPCYRLTRLCLALFLNKDAIKVGLQGLLGPRSIHGSNT